jgi:copper chaperone
MSTVELEISGMSCGHCVKAVQQALATVAGVTTDAVAVGFARVTYDPAALAVAQLRDVVEDAGYAVVAVHDRS